MKNWLDRLLRTSIILAGKWGLLGPSFEARPWLYLSARSSILSGSWRIERRSP